MSGTPLQEFTTLMASQGPAWASGPEAVINEAVRRNYTLARITAGKSMMEKCQGGDEIKDKIFLEEKSTWRRYDPNVGIEYDNPQTGNVWTVPWAFGTAHMSWTKQEVGLNKDSHTGKFRAQKYKSLMFEKHQNLETDIQNSLEDEMWAQPDFTEMESTTPTGARIPLSIPSLISETTTTAPLNSDGTEWATVQKIAPSGKWKNQTGSYTFGTSAADAAAIFAPMSKLFFKLKFAKLPKNGQYSDKTTSPHVILTSLNGMANYEHALRTNQDEFRGIGKTSGQDPDYHLPTFRNCPLDYIESLDTAAIYADDYSSPSSLVTEDSVATAGSHAAGPRYWFINGDYLNFVVHSENYCVVEEPEKLTAAGQPFTWVQNVDCWNNMIVRSRMRQGILYPSTAVTNAAA